MRIIVTGAAGFLGYSVVSELLAKGHYVYALVRPGSKHNERLKGLKNMEIIEGDIYANNYLPMWPHDKCDSLIHLASQGARFDEKAQAGNVAAGLKMIDLAVSAGCKRIIYTGSQAEYGATREIQTEDMPVNPFCPYGKAKVELCNKSKAAAEENNLEWIWGRVFSVYGKYEPGSRMLPQLITAMKNGEEYKLSSGTQNWDYIEAGDAAAAIIALTERGKSGEIYNIANGDYKPLREFAETVREHYNKGRIIYGEDPDPYVSLQPSVEKLKRDTGWSPRKEFSDSLEYEISE